jgi:hypothetical protein
MREAAQQVLDALEHGWIEKGDEVVAALRAALEQPEQRCEYIRTSGNTHWCALGVKNESQ